MTLPRPISSLRTIALAGAFAALASAAAAQSATMPRDFAKVRLGMSTAEVREIRPEASSFDIFGEPEQGSEDAPDLLVEFLVEDPFFDSVDYTFVHGRLCVVKWLRLRPTEDFGDLRARILQGAIGKWGKAYARVTLPFGLPATSEDEGSSTVPAQLRLPGILWSPDDAEILVGYSPSTAADVGTDGVSTDDDSGAEPVPNLVQLVIFQPSCTDALGDQFDLDALTNLDGVPPGLFRDLATKVGGRLFE